MTKEKIRNIQQRIKDFKDPLRVDSGDQIMDYLTSFVQSQGVKVSSEKVGTEYHEIVLVTDPSKILNLLREIHTVSFINTDKPEDKILVNVEANLIYFGDKPQIKISNYAIKMAVVKVFDLKSGGDYERPNSQSSIISTVTIQ